MFGVQETCIIIIIIIIVHVKKKKHLCCFLETALVWNRNWSIECFCVK